MASAPAATVESLARLYYLTPALVEEAARLFEAYAAAPSGGGTTMSSSPMSGGTRPVQSTPAPYITVEGVQRLMVTMGTPLSRKDVVELLRFFGGAAACPIVNGADGDGAAARGSGVDQGGNAAGATSQPSSGRGRKRSAMALAQRAASGREASPPSSRPLGPADGTSDGDAAADTASRSASPVSTSFPQTAVSTEGMNFAAFLYFLLVLPELEQRASSAELAMAAPNASSAGTGTAGRPHAVRIEALFAAMDMDRDGVWSVHDIRNAAEMCVTDDEGLLSDDPDLCRLADMHPAELAAALRELDMDGDGAVTVDDVQLALDF